MNYNELKELLVTEDVCARVKAQEDEIFELIPEFRVCKDFDQKNSWHERQGFLSTQSRLRQLQMGVIMIS